MEPDGSMERPGCSPCCPRKDSTVSDELEQADGSLVREQAPEPPVGNDHPREEQEEEEHYEAATVLPPERHYSR